MLGRLLRFAAPSAASAMAAAVVAGLVEALLQGTSVAVGACAAGAAALLVVPLLFALSLAARALWRAWRAAFAAADEASRSSTADGGLVFGGSLYALLAAVALGGVGFVASRIALTGQGSSAELDPGGVAVAVAVAAAFLLGAGRAAVLGLARVGRGLGLRGRRSGGAAAAGVAGAVAAAVWFAVAGPALARVDYDVAGYGWTAVVVLVAGHAAARRPRLGRRIAGVAAAVSCSALVAMAVVTRVRDPALLFDAWYRTPVGGLAIGMTWDIDSLRDRFLRGVPAPRSIAAAHPDLVLVTIDTVRADRLELYGGVIATPSLAALAARGTAFDWAFAPSNNTRQSVSSIMTGLSPARLRGRVIEFGLKLDPRHVVLGERLRAAGYATAGFLCCPNHLGGPKKIGLDRGLETVGYERRGDELVRLAAGWLADSAGDPRPRFLWVHLFEPHDWMRQPGGVERDRMDQEIAAGLYRRAIEHADRLLGRLVEAVDAGRRPVVLVVTSDHGEGLGEHGALHHASNLYNGQTRVPLVIAGPGIPAGRRVGEPVGLLDLSATILDLAGFAPPGSPAVDSRSFAPLVRGAPGGGAGEAYVVMVRDRSVARTGRALVAGRFKLIAVDGRTPELYDLLADPPEAKNLASRQPAVLTDLSTRLARRRAAEEVSPF